MWVEREKNQVRFRSAERTFGVREGEESGGPRHQRDGNTWKWPREVPCTGDTGRAPEASRHVVGTQCPLCSRHCAGCFISTLHTHL